jgi:hypothetical protein
MTNGPWASQLRNELERGIANYRRPSRWYLLAGAAAAIAVTVAALAVAGEFSGSPRSERTGKAEANRAPQSASSNPGGPVGDPGDAPVGPQVSSIGAAENVSKFNVEVPDTADANAQNVTAIYADQGAVEMQFPAPDEQSKQLDPPYLDVIEHNGDGSGPPVPIERQIAVLQQAFKDAGDDVGLSLMSACNVGSLPALCISPADSEQQKPVCSGTDPVQCSGPHPDTAFVRFVDGNVDVQINGGASVDRLIEIGQSMSSTQGSASPGAG